jgi:2-hydroxy-3-keto-5-methylthiopentenyl-1-phosphate phosphatase
VARNLLVSDFDGTITRTDFFQLIYERYVPRDAPDFLGEWRAGKRTHFDAMAAYFAYAPTEQSVLEGLMDETTPDPSFQQAVERLERAGWDLAIVSAGCAWYIERILRNCRVRATVYSNPGEIVPGRGLVMQRDLESRFFDHNVGVDKAAVVLDAMQRYERVAFAGDGRPDIPPALVVAPENRFARGFLAAELTRRGERFRSFDRWSEVVDALTC